MLLQRGGGEAVGVAQAVHVTGALQGAAHLASDCKHGLLWQTWTHRD